MALKKPIFVVLLGGTRDLFSIFYPPPFQEFIAVRVQDPRVQNEGSWNSHVDYKIFLHVSTV